MPSSRIRATNVRLCRPPPIAAAPPTNAPSDRELVEALVSRDGRDRARGFQSLNPVILRRVKAALRSFEHQPKESDVLDHVQDVWVVLLDDDAALLKNWDATRQVALGTYVGAITWKFVRAKMRATVNRSRLRRQFVRNTWEPSCEEQISARSELTRLHALAIHSLSPIAYQLFADLFLKESSIEELRREYRLSSGGIYAFRSRVRHALRP